MTKIQELDKIDIQILRLLQENCKYTTKELAALINLSTTPTFERQKRLERMGFIKNYVAVLDANRIERGFMVYCTITMQQINKQIAEEFARAVQTWDEVTECYNVSGDGDYMLKVCVSSMLGYQQFILNNIGTFSHIAHIQSIFVMDTLKMSYGFPI
ncbi:MAG: Lrp/AsnC family transcriptional regulator [Prevotellaceae bacterium]|nr:Lrp/AsnC family transcriptional regulator [Prevotellaceae bacterium]